MKKPINLHRRTAPRARVVKPLKARQGRRACLLFGKGGARTITRVSASCQSSALRFSATTKHFAAFGCKPARAGQSCQSHSGPVRDIGLRAHDMYDILCAFEAPCRGSQTFASSKHLGSSGRRSKRRGALCVACEGCVCVSIAGSIIIRERQHHLPHTTHYIHVVTAPWKMSTFLPVATSWGGDS